MPSYVDAVEEYLTRRERAGTRRLPGPAPLLARTVVELCALWAVHCHFDPRPPHPAPTRPSPSTTRQSPRCSPNLSSGLVMLRRSCPCPALPDRPGTTRPARPARLSAPILALVGRYLSGQAARPHGRSGGSWPGSGSAKPPRSTTPPSSCSHRGPSAGSAAVPRRDSRIRIRPVEPTTRVDGLVRLRPDADPPHARRTGRANWHHRGLPGRGRPDRHRRRPQLPLIGRSRRCEHVRVGSGPRSGLGPTARRPVRLGMAAASLTCSGPPKILSNPG
jgi:hypothetical protein